MLKWHECVCVCVWEEQGRGGESRRKKLIFHSRKYLFKTKNMFKIENRRNCGTAYLERNK